MNTQQTSARLEALTRAIRGLIAEIDPAQRPATGNLKLVADELRSALAQAASLPEPGVVSEEAVVKSERRIDGGFYVVVGPYPAPREHGYAMTAIKKALTPPTAPEAAPSADRMAIKMLVAAGFVTEAKANEALQIAHGFASGPLEAAPDGEVVESPRRAEDIGDIADEVMRPDGVCNNCYQTIHGGEQ